MENKISKKTKFVLAVLLHSLIGIVALTKVVSSPVSFVVVGLYLGTVPGLFLLSHIPNLESRVTYMALAPAVSLGFLMLIMLFLILGGSWLSIQLIRPIPVIITVWGTIAAIITSYRYRRDAQLPSFQIQFSRQGYQLLLAGSTLFVGSVAATLLYNLTTMDSVLLVWAIASAFAPLILYHGRDAGNAHIPFLILIGGAFLYFRSLIGTYITGFDAVYNAAYGHLTVATGNAPFGTYSNYASILPPHSIIPVFHFFAGGRIGFTNKFLLPLLYVFVVIPAVYRLSQLIIKTTNHTFDEKHAAAFATLFFIVGRGFHLKVPGVPKQGIAELFLAAGLLSLSATRIKQNPAFFLRSIAILCFLAMAVSHYTTTWLFLGITLISSFLMVLALLVRVLLDHNSASGRLSWLFYYFRNRKNLSLANFFRLTISKNRFTPLLSWTMILLVGTAAVTWYMHIAQEYSFEVLVSAIARTFNLKPSYTRTVVAAPGNNSLGNKGTILLTVVTLGLGGLGVFREVVYFLRDDSLYNIKNNGFNYLFFVGAAFFPIPFYIVSAPGLGLARYLHFTLLLTAPFVLLGFCTLADIGARISLPHIPVGFAITLYLCVSLLFFTGAVSNVEGVDTGVFALDWSATSQDIEATGYILKHGGSTPVIWGDRLIYSKVASAFLVYSPTGEDTKLIAGSGVRILQQPLNGSTSKYQEGNQYVLVHSENTETNVFMVYSLGFKATRAYHVQPRPQQPFLNNFGNKVYSNGNAAVWENANRADHRYPRRFSRFVTSCPRSSRASDSSANCLTR